MAPYDLIVAVNKVRSAGLGGFVVCVYSTINTIVQYLVGLTVHCWDTRKQYQMRLL